MDQRKKEKGIDEHVSLQLRLIDRSSTLYFCVDV